MYVKPSGVFFMAPDLARSLEKRFASSDSFSPESGMWAAIYTKPQIRGALGMSKAQIPILNRNASRCIVSHSDHSRQLHCFRRRLRLLSITDRNQQTCHENCN